MRISSRFFVITFTTACALALVTVPALASRPSASGASRAQAGSDFARAVLVTAAGDEIGRATFADHDGRVVVSAMISALPPDFHGFHVHGTGVCEGPDFTSAGGHYSSTGQSHPGHAGDLPSLYVPGDGTAELRTVTDRFSVSELLDGNGTALIVHANRDNYANIPSRYVPAPDAMTLSTGDAGARLACGVLQAADGPQAGDPT